MNLVIVGDSVARVWVPGLGGADPMVRSWSPSCADAESCELGGGGGHELSGCLGLEVSARRVSEMGSVVLRLNGEDGRGRGAQPRLRSVRTEAGLLLSSPAGNNTSAPCRVIAGHPQFLRLLKPEVKGHPHSLLMSSPARRAAALKKGRARCHPWLGTK